MQTFVLIAIAFSALSVYQLSSSMRLEKKRFQVAIFSFTTVEVIAGILFIVSITYDFEDIAAITGVINIVGLILVFALLLFAREWKSLLIFSPALLWVVGVCLVIGDIVLFPQPLFSLLG